MNTRIALGTGLSLTLGTAVAGTLIYGPDTPRRRARSYQATGEAMIPAHASTPETIAMWKATAVSTEHSRRKRRSESPAAADESGPFRRLAPTPTPLSAPADSGSNCAANHT